MKSLLRLGLRDDGLRMSIMRNEVESATNSSSLSLQDKRYRIPWLIFLGLVIGALFQALLSEKTDKFEIVAQLLVWGAIGAFRYSLAAFFSPRLGQRQLLTTVLLSLNLFVGLNILLMA